MPIWIFVFLNLLTFSAAADDQDLLDRFLEESEKRQEAILEQTETALAELDLPLVRLVKSLLVHPCAPATPPPFLQEKSWFDENKYAPGLPIKRKVLPEEARLLREGSEKFLKIKVWYELRSEYRYRLGRNSIVRLSKDPLPVDRLRQYLRGYPPHADLAMEILLKVLDTETSWDKYADYFDHTYTDREGNVYPGITLFDVWNSGQELECPDVDVIPYAWEILGDTSWKSPIPAGQRRTDLYRTIGESFREFRRYRYLREGVAATFFASSTTVSPYVVSLQEEFHFLIARWSSDPAELARFLAPCKDYREFNNAVADLYRAHHSDCSAVIDERKQWLEADHAKIREVALEALTRQLAE